MHSPCAFWLDGSGPHLRRFPTSIWTRNRLEAAIADASGCSLNAATRETERTDTLDHAGAMADALADGAISAGHVDALTRATKNLDTEATNALFDDDETLAEAASTRSIAEFDKFIKAKAKALDTSDAEERLEKQKRATRLRTWTDDDGMFNLTGRFDPDLGRQINLQLSDRLKSKFAASTPETAPEDPIERRQHLQGLALADLILGDGERSAGGTPIVVVDASKSDGAGGPVIDWGIPVELPLSVLHELFDTRKPDVIVVRNGVVLHAPGTLNQGRETRLANRPQRRALRALYSTCAVPGCSVHYDRCKLHHIIYWRNGGRTDLDNLLPVCQHHHSRIHANDWQITLGPNRELTIRLPNGQILQERDRHKHSAA